MFRIAAVILLFLIFLPGISQDFHPGYSLQVGTNYYIDQELLQTTRTQSFEYSGDISLDVKFRLNMNLLKSIGDSTYLFSARYSKTELNYSSPGNGYAISRMNSDNSSLNAYLEGLEKINFNIWMTDRGKFTVITKLDSAISKLQHRTSIEPVKHENITGTLREAFGKNALVTLSANITHLYGDTKMLQLAQSDTIFINATPTKLSRSLYYQYINTETFRVQGIGIIEETNGTLNIDGAKLVTTMEGKHTFDLLCDTQSGWIIEGIMKQNLHQVSVVEGHDTLPDGLKIPTIVESEYNFAGGTIEKSE